MGFNFEPRNLLILRVYLTGSLKASWTVNARGFMLNGGTFWGAEDAL